MRPMCQYTSSKALVTTSVALVTTSVALVTTSFFVTSSKALSKRIFLNSACPLFLVASCS